jgi:hypothetical protein
MLEKALRLCNASRGHVWGYDGEGLTALAIRGGAEVGEWFRQVGRLIPSPETPVGWVVQGEDLVHVADVTKSGHTPPYRCSGATSMPVICGPFSPYRCAKVGLFLAFSRCAGEMFNRSPKNRLRS